MLSSWLHSVIMIRTTEARAEIISAIFNLCLFNNVYGRCERRGGHLAQMMDAAWLTLLGQTSRRSPKNDNTTIDKRTQGQRWTHCEKNDHKEETTS